MLNFLSPPNCFHCEKLGGWICQRCLEEISWCHSTSPRPLTHPSITNIYSVVEYRDTIEELIALVKKDYYSSFTELWAQLTYLAYPRLLNPKKDILVPMPTTRGRWWERGFSPVALYASYLSRLTQVPVASHLLIRNKESEHLAQKNKLQRKNIDHGFALKNAFPSKNIWLLDDVLTTGATVNRCAQLFASQGKSLQVLTFSQTP